MVKVDVLSGNHDFGFGIVQKRTMVKDKIAKAFKVLDQSKIAL